MLLQLRACRQRIAAARERERLALRRGFGEHAPYEAVELVEGVLFLEQSANPDLHRFGLSLFTWDHRHAPSTFVPGNFSTTTKRTPHSDKSGGT